MSEKLNVLIALHSKPELADIEGQMVYQVWSDGEITLKKAAMPFANTHTIEHPISPLPVARLPEEDRDNTSYVYTTERGAYEIRCALIDKYIEQLMFLKDQHQKYNLK